ncbi:60 kDa lysophospholipase-like [Rhinichthys klamathensis goyatoka]|uniref:60 kDa lysophospholipase-like n=1 Tax=Rhinichthys klamathensis goyatoka TaxID=3034132 RepID=UPI0024B4807A|nr:60 kDa lysophospholipase-like [Rhinichthys klamathensis goyatoka]
MAIFRFVGTASRPIAKRLSKKNVRVVYRIKEYSPLLDSSNMTPADWEKIAKDIETNYEQCTGFVVLHGTDTMAYTSSALSFMCENLGKPVIVTGSQLPIYELRTDGRDNLLVALLLAGRSPVHSRIIPEVCLFFCQKLYRGNRATKVDCAGFNAFTSPNLSPLADVEIDIKINWDIILWPSKTEKFTVDTRLNSNVGVLRLFPGITDATVENFLQPPMAGVILETFGSGNAPDRKSLIDIIKKATARGVIMVNCTQCLRGSVTTAYATGQALTKAGVIAGFDMTPEAALSKLSYVLTKQDLTPDKKKEMMQRSLRGELTDDSKKPKLSDSRFIQVIAKSLSIKCDEELGPVRDALTPTLVCVAAKTGDIEALEALREMGSDLIMADYDGRTPLHVAACAGHVKVVEYLLSKGASVYARDRFGETPLHSAVHGRHKDVVKLLRKTGAHFSPAEMADAGTKLHSLVASGDSEGLEIWQLAGVDQKSTGVARATGTE